MSRIRLLVDEDAQHRGLAAALRVRDIDIVTVNEAALTGENDEIVLAHAAGDARVLYTFNAGDFCRIHADRLRRGQGHAGIIIVPYQRYSIGEQLRRLLQVINSKSAEDMQNGLEFL